MSAPLYKLPDEDRRLRIGRLRGQIVDLVVSPGRDERMQTYRGTVIGAAYNLGHGKPTEIILETETGRLVCASSAIVVSIENPQEASS